MKHDDKEEKMGADVKVAPERAARWAAFLKAHEAQNPVKHAERLAKGELSKIPDSFV